MSTRDWSPFSVAPIGAPPQSPRSIQNRDGIGDRLRAAAFAEIQAREAFNWAADTFVDAGEELRQSWRMLARAEERHLQWLLNRMTELGIEVRERQVSDHLWHSLVACKTARDFAVFIANAEERGRRAGERFCDALRTSDPISSAIFGRIAEEEVSHIELATRFFPDYAPTPVATPSPRA